jgi:hypothetical protein
MASITKISIPTQAIPNSSADKTPYAQLEDFTSKASGALRVVDLSQKAIKLVNEVNKVTGRAPVLTELESKLGAGKSVLVLPYLPVVTNNARKAIEEAVANPGDTQKLLKAHRNTFEATAMVAAAGNLVLQNPVLGKAVGIFSFAEDTTDVAIRSRDLVHCNEMLAEIERRENSGSTELRVTEEVKVSVSDTKTFTMMRLIKAVCGAVGGFFGLGLLAIGSTVAAPLAAALVVLGLAATVSAVAGEFFKESRMYNLVSL